MYGLLRHWRIGPAGAFLGALGYAFGTLSICSLEYLPMLGATLWAPLIFLTASRVAEFAAKAGDDGAGRVYPFREGAGPVLCFTASLTGIYLLSGPGWLYYGAPLIGCYVVARFLCTRTSAD